MKQLKLACIAAAVLFAGSVSQVSAQSTQHCMDGSNACYQELRRAGCLDIRKMRQRMHCSPYYYPRCHGRPRMISVWACMEWLH